MNGYVKLRGKRKGPRAMPQRPGILGIYYGSQLMRRTRVTLVARVNSVTEYDFVQSDVEPGLINDSLRASFCVQPLSEQRKGLPGPPRDLLHRAPLLLCRLQQRWKAVSLLSRVLIRREALCMANICEP
jgi:hypothetical protein